MDALFPEILEELRSIPAESFLLDGEIVALDESGRSSFQLLQNRINRGRSSRLGSVLHETPVFYMAFDLLACQGYDLRSVTLAERLKILKALLPENERIRLVDTLSEHGRQFFELVTQQHLEGIVAKDSESTYQSGRSMHWQKIKSTHRELFVVGGYTPPSGGRRFFGALLVGLYRSGGLEFCGRVGTGFTEADLEGIFQKLQLLSSADCPFSSPPDEIRDARWVSPQLVSEVKFGEWTKGQLLRHPVFVELKPGADPAACTAAAEGPEPESEASPGDLSGYTFLTNLEKVFWQEEGYTKGDLVRYYDRIAPILLPHLKDRPMNLERYPDGAEGKSFYQKDVPEHFPHWVTTAVIESDSSKSNRYVVCNDRESLVYLANLACIPLHPWSSRLQTLEFPDYMILDLDPDPKVPFAEVCRFALRVREILEGVELDSFVKTSGSKGLHVLVPLEPEYDYSQVRHFAEIVARLATHGFEEIATIDRSMTRRKGRIYVDFLQNGRGKTIVSPYCLRPRPKAPVSTPLEWTELTGAFRPETFHMKNIFRRLETKGDLLEGLLRRKQSLRGALERLGSFLEGPSNDQ